MNALSSVEVAVRGGGVIGLSVALAAARAGFSVSVFDDGSPHAGSRVAGGMLAPLTEAWPGEEAVVAQGVEALAMWPEFAASIGVPLFEAGTLAVGTQPGDLADLRHAGDLLTSREIRALEPSLGPAVRGGVYAAGDLAVDNRVLLSALWKACLDAGVVSSVEGRVTVIAAGAWSGRLHPALKDVIRPVKGEILRLSHRPGALPPPRHTIRALVSGRPVYLVPRDDGLVVGATQYEAGFDTDVSVAGVRDLLRDAETVLPGIAEYALTEAAVGFRAGSPDNVPIVRFLEPGVIAATGHHRNGLLLAPHTARLVVELIQGGSS
ncbi:FAD-dependent oxidoreductase [Lentzea kristufekii]|uniref:FAD-dependent oxidoreductase n=1 Tax=Lentzea kristufekii TaxID=3095430 RepID=UPI00387396D5